MGSCLWAGSIVIKTWEETVRMSWKKNKSSADPQQGSTVPAAGKGGPAAFVKKNWKWLVPVAVVVLAGGWWVLKP